MSSISQNKRKAKPMCLSLKKKKKTQRVVSIAFYKSNMIFFFFFISFYYYQPVLAWNCWQDILEWDPASLGPSETGSRRREEESDNLWSEWAIGKEQSHADLDMSCSLSPGVNTGVPGLTWDGLLILLRVKAGQVEVCWRCEMFWCLCDEQFGVGECLHESNA